MVRSTYFLENRPKRRNVRHHSGYGRCRHRLETRFQYRERCREKFKKELTWVGCSVGLRCNEGGQKEESDSDNFEKHCRDMKLCNEDAEGMDPSPGEQSLVKSRVYIPICIISYPHLNQFPLSLSAANGAKRKL